MCGVWTTPTRRLLSVSLTSHEMAAGLALAQEPQLKQLLLMSNKRDDSFPRAILEKFLRLEDLVDPLERHMGTLNRMKKAAF